ncbi:uncharacterized protein LOC143252844 [Tachypleus tridentatus]|uniref:uncharacterized protein LOC143252844 n=1 Tax=Tachypleus tridentatus TaxID=6853 RepID=UPI003FD5AD2F
MSKFYQRGSDDDDDDDEARRQRRKGSRSGLLEEKHVDSDRRLGLTYYLAFQAIVQKIQDSSCDISLNMLFIFNLDSFVCVLDIKHKVTQWIICALFSTSKY